MPLSVPIIQFLVITLLLVCLADHNDPLPKDEFDECVAQCGVQLEECTVVMRSLWYDFAKNKRRIFKLINKCCLSGQADHSKPSNLSFATCVRNKCNARLWGCMIKKRHLGVYSQNELKDIEHRNKGISRRRSLDHGHVAP